MLGICLVQDGNFFLFFYQGGATLLTLLHPSDKTHRLGGATVDFGTTTAI